MELGTTLEGRYRIESVIGRGGMGVVYLGQHLMLGTRVAIKEMALGDSAERDYAFRAFRREAHLLASAGGHPNLVRAMDCFEDGGSLYLVMDYVEGRDLARLLNDSPGPLPLTRVLHWADQICDVLEYLHSQVPPIIYRDLKPANVMVNAKDRVCLIDFGIARTFAPGSASATRTVTYSPGYAPIEQYGQGEIDPRTDVYALGATLYAVLTRTAPPPSVEIAAGVARPELPSRLNPAIPQALDTLLAQMMAVRAVDRCPSMSAVRARLRTILAAVEASPSPAQRYCQNCGEHLAVGGNCPRCAPEVALETSYERRPDWGAFAGASPAISPGVGHAPGGTAEGSSVAFPPWETSSPGVGSPNPSPPGGGGLPSPPGGGGLPSSPGGGGLPSSAGAAAPWRASLPPAPPLPPFPSAVPRQQANESDGRGNPAWGAGWQSPAGPLPGWSPSASQGWGPPNLPFSLPPPGSGNVRGSSGSGPSVGTRALLVIIMLVGLGIAVWSARGPDAPDAHVVTAASSTVPVATAPSPVPVVSESPTPLASVVGTKWSGVDSDGDRYTYFFRSGGHLEYSSPSGHAFFNGSTWSQDGNQLSWTINHYSRYTAAYQDGRLVGRASNPAGHQWTFQLYRDLAPATPLAGTIWRGTDSDHATWTVKFNADGTLDYQGQRAQWHYQGAWNTLDDGWTLVILLNHYAHWKATVDGDYMFGTAENARPMRWTFTATRQAYR